MFQQRSAQDRLLTMNAVLNAVLNGLQAQATQNDDQDRRLFCALEIQQAEHEAERQWMVSQVQHLLCLHDENQELRERVRFYEDGI